MHASMCQRSQLLSERLIGLYLRANQLGQGLWQLLDKLPRQRDAKRMLAPKLMPGVTLDIAL